jgi:hypothetical protein
MHPARAIVGDTSAFATPIVFFLEARHLLNVSIFVTLVIGAITLASGGTLRYSTERNTTRVEIRPSKRAAAKAQILLPRDETIAPASPVQDFELLGEKPSGVYVLTDRYASRPGPMSYCQSGQEQFVRVLARSHGLRETFSLKVQSCRSNLELGPAGVSWENASSTLRVDGVPPKRYHVGDDGLVTALATPY